MVSKLKLEFDAETGKSLESCPEKKKKHKTNREIQEKIGGTVTFSMA